MAALVRLGLQQGCRKLRRFAPLTQQLRHIKTSKKEGSQQPETLYGDNLDRLFHPDKDKKQASIDDDENWVSQGYNWYDRRQDRFDHHSYLFMFCTLVFPWWAFWMNYAPDWGDRDWTMREAYLLLEDREKKGLPLIDPNLIPIEKILPQLPTDEELGDEEVIV